jgi:plastocyanin
MIRISKLPPLAVVAGALLAFGVTGAVAQQIAAAGPAEIAIQNFAFLPATLTVARGSTVTWVNRDEEPHNIVNVDQPRVFRSAAVDGGEKFSFTFSNPGTYKYICSIHPHMSGTVVVQ